MVVEVGFVADTILLGVYSKDEKVVTGLVLAAETVREKLAKVVDINFEITDVHSTYSEGKIVFDVVTRADKIAKTAQYASRLCSYITLEFNRAFSAYAQAVGAKMYESDDSNLIKNILTVANVGICFSLYKRKIKLH